MASRLSSLLVRDGLVGVKRMEKAYQRQVIYGGSLDTILLEMNLVPEDRLTQYLALASGLPPAARDEATELDPAAIALLDKELSQQFRAVPLATDPALVMGIVLFTAIGMTYLLVFHIVLGRTLGMRVMKIRVIDVYGDRPSPARCAARCAGYLAGVATLVLGFLWMGFDSEKRGLQDWIAGTYVIRA